MLGLLVFLATAVSSGEVVDSSEFGFASRNSIQVSASPDAVFGALGALAGAVDGVVRGQLESLARYVDEP